MLRPELGPTEGTRFCPRRDAPAPPRQRPLSAENTKIPGQSELLNYVSVPFSSGRLRQPLFGNTKSADPRLYEFSSLTKGLSTESPRAPECSKKCSHILKCVPKLIDPAQVSCLNIHCYIGLPNMIYSDSSIPVFMKR